MMITIWLSLTIVGKVTEPGIPKEAGVLVIFLLYPKGPLPTSEIPIFYTNETRRGIQNLLPYPRFTFLQVKLN